MIAPDILADLDARCRRADERYGAFTSTHEALGVACEEWDELRDAIRANAFGSVEMECLDLAAVLVRLAGALRQGDVALLRRSGK